MKKVWDITVSDELPAETRKKIKKILRPTRPDILRPQKCLFCGELTSWVINGKPVCPKDAVRYGFLSELWLLDPCEVCGKQGEWATSPPRDQLQHFLCYHHRDQWFHWTIPELKFIDGKLKPTEWQKAWNEGWVRFIKQQKALIERSVENS
jgi:hypothetical protein